MKIEQLTRDLIPEVTKHGNRQLVRDITRTLDKAEEMGASVYVCHGPKWLQYVTVDAEMLDQPDVQEALGDLSFWYKHVRVGEREAWIASGGPVFQQ